MSQKINIIPTLKGWLSSHGTSLDALVFDIDGVLDIVICDQALFRLLVSFLMPRDQGCVMVFLMKAFDEGF